MKSPNRQLPILGAFLGLSCLSAAVAADDKPVPPKAPADHAATHGQDGTHDMKEHGDQDYKFATMMREHHAKALEMAKKELRDGKAPQMKAMAQKIVDGQTREIAELDAWLSKNKPTM